MFAGWMMPSPRAAAGVGYLTGVVFFALSFAWFGETAGALLGPFGFILDLGPALIESFAFALAAAVASYGARRLTGPWLPVTVAAGFTLAEALRSSGLLGVPLYQVGAAFVDTPLAPLAAYGGVYALTFVVALPAAAFAALVHAGARRRRAARDCAVAVLLVVVIASVGWLAWPARALGPATLRVAVVQGNIRQAVKWQASSLAVAVDRYTQLSASVRAFRPQFVLWPETVITTDLLLSPDLEAIPENAAIAAASRRLRERFGRLATSLNALLAVGTIEATGDGPYDDLVFFDRDASEWAYRKRQLVPFAEFLPGPPWLRGLPFASLISNFSAGGDSAPIDARLRIGPLICWETDFTDLAMEQVTHGARFFAVATDDAWFGDSDGPYAQAQIAQLRAIETGRWIVRAASTGISGIVAPNGRWQAATALDTAAALTGTIGAPQPTVYDAIGPWPVIAAMGVLLAAGLIAAATRRPA